MYSAVYRIAVSKLMGKELSVEVINNSIEETEQVIMNYCGIPKVPPALRYTWANMAVDLSLYVHEVSKSPEEVSATIDPADVSSIKLGDASITVGDKYRASDRSRTLQSHANKLDDIVMNYKSQLNRFRCLW